MGSKRASRGWRSTREFAILRFGRPLSDDAWVTSLEEHCAETLEDLGYMPEDFPNASPIPALCAVAREAAPYTCKNNTPPSHLSSPPIHHDPEGPSSSSCDGGTFKTEPSGPDASGVESGRGSGTDVPREPGQSGGGSTSNERGVALSTRKRVAWVPHPRTRRRAHLSRFTRGPPERPSAQGGPAGRPETRTP